MDSGERGLKVGFCGWDMGTGHRLAGSWFPLSHGLRGGITLKAFTEDLPHLLERGLLNLTAERSVGSTLSKDSTQHLVG